MAVPSNPKLSDIQTEFGGSNPIELTEYYSGGPLVPAGSPAPNGPIPSSGQISMGQFRCAVNAAFICASGGTITTSGDYKIHTFTGPGTFTVNSVGNPAGSNSVDYLVIAGGGGTGGRNCQTGAGGAGGFRLSNSTCMPAPLTSPLANPTGLPVSATGYPITVGAGGPPAGAPDQPSGIQGSPSTFSTITSAGGGKGTGATIGAGHPGGSGGGGMTGSGGTGNQPPVSPSQGNPGGPGSWNPPEYGSGGGGGAGASGSPGGTGGAGAGGIGSYTVINPAKGTPGPVGSTRYFAGGGGGASENQGASGGAGGGGNGAANGGTSTGGTANTGSGAGSGNGPGDADGSGGGSGIVIIRYKFQ
jgi:hypothetical protein